MRRTRDVTASKEGASTDAMYVTFYTKMGCHLCEEARDMLDEIAQHVIFELTEFDIRSDPALFEHYRYRIPVVIINDGALNNDTLLEGHITREDLAQAFDLV